MTPDGTTRQPPVLVTGFHRSGTSAIARSLHSAGLDLGGELLGAEPANPYGHFEDTAAIEVHDRLLEAESLTWKSLDAPRDTVSASSAIDTYVTARQRAFEDSESVRWGVKDPRLCLFLGSWLSVVPEADIVFVLRPPGPTVASLHRRHIRRHVDTRGIDPSDLDFWRIPDLGLRLWIHYHRTALETLHDRLVHVVEYGCDDTDETVNSVAKHLGLSQPELPVDPTLGRATSQSVIDPGLLDEASDIWSAFQRLRNSRRDPTPEITG